MSVLEGLEPERVFRYFEEISAIPRGSGNEKAISDYLVDFAASRELEVYRDAALNVIIRKPATAGYENSLPVMVQGHMDMVCEKNADTKHDFEKDPLKLYIDGDHIKARGTTLGADNGIAVAYGLALLDSGDIEHPPLEIVITVAEETGLEGAALLEEDKLKSRRMINMDSGREGVFTTSCAGGVRTTLRMEGRLCDAPEGFVCVKYMVKGLTGGHSGADIHHGRANANMLAGQVLYSLDKEFDIYLAELDGGLKDNAIPREAFAVLAASSKDISGIESAIKKHEAVFKTEYANTDPDLEIAFEQLGGLQGDGKVFAKEFAREVAQAIMLTPNGVQAMDANIPGMVETSTNLGVIKTVGTAIDLTSAIRSSVATKKRLIEQKIFALAECLGASAESKSDYPSWEYRKDSDIRKTVSETYAAMFGKEPVLTGIHAGLECGVLSGKIPDMDIIAFGPDNFGPHTPEESLGISSTARIWSFLLQVLKNL